MFSIHYWLASIMSFCRNRSPKLFQKIDHFCPHINYRIYSRISREILVIFWQIFFQFDLYAGHFFDYLGIIWLYRWLNMVFKNAYFGQFFGLIFSIRLIRGSTYTRVYTVCKKNVAISFWLNIERIAMWVSIVHRIHSLSVVCLFVYLYWLSIYHMYVKTMHGYMLNSRLWFYSIKCKENNITLIVLLCFYYIIFAQFFIMVPR